MQTIEIQIIGESVVDCVERLDGSSMTHPGGSAANVAIGLARLGRQVGFLTQLGVDRHGALMRDHLERAGVQLRVADADGARTPSARAVLDQSGAAHYELDVDWLLNPAAVQVGQAHLHLGSFPAFLSEPTDVDDLLRRAHAVTTTSLDPNIRPALLPPSDLVRDRLESLLAWIDVIKASDEDIAWLYPGRDPIDVVSHWLDLGPALAVVTLGSEGSIAAGAAGLVRVPAQRVEVADTVGAGDSYMSALLDGLAGTDLIGTARRRALHASPAETMQPIIERAAHAAAITVTRPGANPPTRDELRAGPKGTLASAATT